MTDNNHTTCPTCEKQFHDMDTLDGKICFSCATDALAAADRLANAVQLRIGEGGDHVLTRTNLRMALTAYQKLRNKNE
jgi:hypothetical protein